LTYVGFPILKVSSICRVARIPCLPGWDLWELFGYGGGERKAAQGSREFCRGAVGLELRAPARGAKHWGGFPWVQSHATATSDHPKGVKKRRLGRPNGLNDREVRVGPKGRRKRSVAGVCCGGPGFAAATLNGDFHSDFRGCFDWTIGSYTV
jgi:hypothetical protein